MLALSGMLAFASASPAQPVLQTLHHHLPQIVADGKATLVGTLPPEQQLNFSMVLPLRNKAELDKLLDRLYDPSSPNYRRFLTVAQFTDQFGPTAADYQTLVSFARAQGFVITGAPANRMVVPVRGTVDQVSKAFHLNMNVYRHPSEERTFFSPDREPSLNLAVTVAHIAGLNNFSIPRPMVRRSQQAAQFVNVTGSGPSGSYLASDMRTAYYGATILDGIGQSVGLLEFGGYNIFDVNQTFSTAGQSYTVPVNNVLLDGAVAESDGDDAEQVLDIVQAIGMAPGLSQVRVYIGTGSDDANILNSMASENIARQLSCSWGWLPEDPATDDVFFKEFAAQGQSFFAASGDSGALDAAIDPYFYPAEDANVTAVGGTHLTTNGPAGTWASETVWNDYGSASGGGISPDGIALPTWQSGVANLANGGSTTLRNIPDVAMEGDYDNYLCTGGECYEDFAGTSFAAPRWAAFTALINQQAVEAGTAPQGGIGFLNPAIYALGKGSDYSKDFHDITIGNNDSYDQTTWYVATAGYDLVTGWGSASGQNLIVDLAGKQVPGFWIGAAPTLQVIKGSSVSTTVAITGAGGFSGSVSLALSSPLPSGVTASWETNPTSGSTVLTLKASSAAQAGTSTVTITGTSGKLTSTAKVIIVVEGPTFVLASDATSLALNPGSSVTSTIYLTPEFGFTGSAKLSIAGLPSGVTASFSPNPIAGQSTLTLTASASAALSKSASNLTITGTSGAITASTTIFFQVAQPTFAFYLPSTLAMGQGGTYSAFLFVYPENGFNSQVTFAVSGLPAGVTASISPNPTLAGVQQPVLTLTSTSQAAFGNTTVTVTGVSGQLKVSNTATLAVLPPTFGISGPGSVGIGLGGSSTPTIAVLPEYGFTGSVNFSVSGLPAGVTASFSPNPTIGSSILTLTAGSKAVPGSVNAKITGVSGKLTATTALTVGVFAPAFTVTAPTSASIGQGTSSIYNININPEYGFLGAVNLAVAGLPSGVTASISPNPTNASATLTLNASATAALGTALLKITGTSGKLTSITSLSLGVFAPTFTLAGPGSANLGQGMASTFSLQLYPEYGFTGNVNLSISGLPQGVTAAFSPNPATGSTTLTLTAAATATLGTVPVTVKGTSGKLTSSISFPLGIYAPTFLLTTAGNVNVGLGTSFTTVLYINAEYGFTGNVNLAITGLPTGVTAHISPNPTLGTAQLVLTASNTAKLGTYPLIVTGTCGSLKVTSPLNLGLFQQNFTISAPSSASIGQGSTSTLQLVVNPAYGFTGSVDLTASGLPSGVTASFSPNPTTAQTVLTLTASKSAQLGPQTIAITGVSGKLSASATVTLTTYVPTFTFYPPGSASVARGGSSTTYINVNPEYGFTGSVNLGVTGLPSGVTASFSPNPTSESSTLTLNASSSAAMESATLNITGTWGTQKASTTLPLSVNAPTFAIQPPGNISLGQGSSTTETIFVDLPYGSSSSVNLAVSGLPAGVTASFSVDPTTYLSILTVTASSKAAIGSSTLTIVGTSGKQTTTATVPLNIYLPTFTLGNPGNLTVGQASSAIAWVYISAQNGFTGSVKMAVSGLAKGVTASFSPNPTTGQTMLTINASSTAPLGAETLTLTATSGTQTLSNSFSLTVLAPGFTVQTSGDISLVPGSSETSYLYVQPANGFAGSVKLVVTGLPSGVTAVVSPNPTTGQATIVFTAGAKAAPGTSNLTITGTSGTQTESASVSLTVAPPSFTLNTDGNVTIGQGTSVNTDVYEIASNGFDGTINLAISGLPTGVTASFAQNPISGSTVLTLTASATAPLGYSTLTISGSSGALKVTTTLSLTVSPPSFSVYTYFHPVVALGSSTTAEVEISFSAGSTGNVQLYVSGLPMGVNAHFTPNPTVNGYSILYFEAAQSASTGEYNVTVTGVFGKQTQSTTLSLTVVTPGFNLSSSGSNGIGRGTSATSYIYVNQMNGFTANVNLSITGLPPGVTATFSPNPASTNSTLTLTASKTAALGQYTATILGVSGTLTASTTITFTVYIRTFTLSSNSPGTISPGSAATAYVSIYDEYGFTGPVSLTVSGLPKGVTASISPNPTSNGNAILTLNTSAAASVGQYNFTITGSGGGQTASTTATVTILPPTFSINAESGWTLGQGSSTAGYVNLYSQGTLNSSVKLAVTGLPSGVTASFSPNPTTGSTVLTLSATASASLGQYDITITGTSGTQTASTTIPITIYTPTFTIGTPYNFSIGQGTSTPVLTSINAEYGFTGAVKLAISGLPPGVTASFAPNPTASGSTTMTLTASSTAALGEYNVTLTGTSGTQTVSSVFAISVYTPTFTINGPSNVQLGQGASNTTYTQINPEYGFTGSVKLGVSGLPPGVTASFSPNPTNGTTTLTLTATAAAAVGQYNININGLSGTQTATTSFTLAILAPTFTLEAFSLDVSQGNTGSSPVYIYPQNGFDSAVSLSITGLPKGVTASFSPASTTSGSSTLTLNIASTVPAGVYKLTVTGVSGKQSSSISIQLGVLAPS